MSCQNAKAYYENCLDQYKLQTEEVSKRMILLSVLRILVFVSAVLGVYLTFHLWQIALSIGGIGIVLFLYLLSQYTSVKQKKKLYKALVQLNEEELKIDAKDFYHRNTGEDYQDPNHNYCLDMDLFGRGSFFQYVNRTATKAGEMAFADALKANAISGIAKRQEAIKELASQPEWRQFYTAQASLVALETPAKDITNWLQNYKPALPKMMLWLSLVFSIATTILFITAYFKVLTQSAMLYWLVLGLGITGVYVKHVGKLAANSDKIKDTFRQYAVLLNQIEHQEFKSVLLQEKQQQIKSETVPASTVFKQLSKALDALDNRNNIIGAIFGNGLFLNDIRNSCKIEQWIANYGEKVSDWFEVVAFFDAYNTLANFTFNHQAFAFPELSTKPNLLKVQKLGHPMLNANKRVDSDVTINNEAFFIITGANMAGKSTFLRAVSLHIVMANMGLPVCATSSKYTPVQLITSMRTTDSLTDDTSYFFSELKRLKYIVDAIADRPYFIVLDEILKGTNSTDKAIGSRKFVEKLVASKATGIIATHDLSLCAIAETLPSVSNYYFDAEIINDELHFDYTLKTGVCKNMNASFLLQKMEII